MEEERFIPENGQEGRTQGYSLYNVKRIWTRSTQCGRISIIAALLGAIFLINLVTVFSGRGNPEVTLDLDNKTPEPVDTLPPHVVPTIPSPFPELPTHQPPTPEHPNAEPTEPASPIEIDEGNHEGNDGTAINPVAQPVSMDGRNYSKEAYVTLLTPAHPHPWSEGKPDYYFEAAKIKAHRILRNTTTRDPHNRPFIVLVTEAVPAKQIEILEDHGAIVRRVSTIEPPPGTVDLSRINPRYRDQFTKLHVWNMTEYNRIAFFDADTLPIRAVDSIFDTPIQRGEDNEEYLFGAVYDSGASRRDNNRNPPGPDDKGRQQDNVLNAGVFLLWPNQRQADYIFNILRDPPQRDWTVFMEQSMLRWAYRESGPYPWIRLSHLYNTQWCKAWDLDTAYVLHDKLWGEGNHVDAELRRVWYAAWGEMVGWDVPRREGGIALWQEELGICNP
jgi:alpha-N-acetylglucosamine transferase